MTPQDTMRLALEALEYASTGNRRPEIIGPAIEALKAALAQQGEQQPVAWLFTNVHSGDIEVSTDYDWNEGEREMWHRTPLYAGAAPAAQPLSDEQILALEVAHGNDLFDDRDVIAFARAIEAAHGIGVQK